VTGQKKIRIPKELRAVGFDERWARGLGCDAATLRMLVQLIRSDADPSAAELSSESQATASGKTVRT
jgi:hypothetical protein